MDASWQSLHSLWHGHQCREDQADDKQHQWHHHRDQSEWTEAWDNHKLQIPGLSYNWWGFQAWDTLFNSTENSGIDMAETSLAGQEYFFQLQDTTDTLPCHIHLPACLRIMDPHSRAPKKNTSHGNEVLPQDTTHLIQTPYTNEEVRAKIQQATGQHKDLPTILNRRKLQWYGHVSHSSGLAKTNLQGTVKGEEDKADRGRSGKTSSGNGQVWNLASPRGQWRTGKMEKTGCKIICGAPTTLTVKGLMMMMTPYPTCIFFFFTLELWLSGSYICVWQRRRRKKGNRVVWVTLSTDIWILSRLIKIK